MTESPLPFRVRRCLEQRFPGPMNPSRVGSDVTWPKKPLSATRAPRMDLTRAEGTPMFGSDSVRCPDLRSLMECCRAWRTHYGYARAGVDPTWPRTRCSAAGGTVWLSFQSRCFHLLSIRDVESSRRSFPKAEESDSGKRPAGAMEKTRWPVCQSTAISHNQRSQNSRPRKK